MANKCSALVSGVCINGFMVTPACNPIQAPWRCHACGRDSDGQPTPVCMHEDWSARIFPDTGCPEWPVVERMRERVGYDRAALSHQESE